MTLSTSMKTRSSADLRDDLEIIEVKRGVKFSVGVLKQILPDIETTLFFGKVYDLNAGQLGHILARLHNSSVSEALFGGAHSTDLQGYIIELGYQPQLNDGTIVVQPDVAHGEILPEVWKSLEVEVAQAIKDVAAKLGDHVSLLPGKQGKMVFQSLMQMNRRRPTIGVHAAGIKHHREADNLVILDVSGSMSRPTVHALAEDVVAMSYMANAHMAIVSNTCTHWEPGTYNAYQVLAASEFGGTHYEELAPLFESRQWGTVVTVADYDSSQHAKEFLAKVGGQVETVVDISLVNRTTFLAECVGQFAKEVRPILIAQGTRPRELAGA